MPPPPWWLGRRCPENNDDWAPNGNITSADGCVPCPTGEYAPNAREFSCTNDTNVEYICKEWPAQCERCPPGTLNWHRGGVLENCVPCPPAGIDCFLQGQVEVLPGFFRPDDESPVAYRCPLGQGCLGGTGSSCKDGYTGLLCGVCSEIDGRPSYRTSASRCEPCPDAWLANTLLAVVIVLLLFLIFDFFRRQTHNPDASPTAWIRQQAIKSYAHVAWMASKVPQGSGAWSRRTKESMLPEEHTSESEKHVPSNEREDGLVKRQALSAASLAEVPHDRRSMKTTVVSGCRAMQLSLASCGGATLAAVQLCYRKQQGALSVLIGIATGVLIGLASQSGATAIIGLGLVGAAVACIYEYQRITNIDWDFFWSLVRIIVTYMQCVSVFVRLEGVKWPPAFTYFLETMAAWVDVIDFTIHNTGCMEMGPIEQLRIAVLFPILVILPTILLLAFLAWWIPPSCKECLDKIKRGGRSSLSLSSKHALGPPEEQGGAAAHHIGIVSHLRRSTPSNWLKDKVAERSQVSWLVGALVTSIVAGNVLLFTKPQPYSDCLKTSSAASTSAVHCADLVVNLRISAAACAVIVVILVAWLASIVFNTNGRAGDRQYEGISEALLYIGYWMIVLLMPAVSRTCLATFDVFDQKFRGDELLRSYPDPRLRWGSDRWTEMAWWSSIGFIVYGLFLPYFPFGYAAGRNGNWLLPELTFSWVFGVIPVPTPSWGAPFPSQRKWRVLHSAYREDLWWFELVALWQKLLLAGVVGIVSPGWTRTPNLSEREGGYPRYPRVQMWFGLLVSLFFSYLYVMRQPYKDSRAQWLQQWAQMQLVFTYLTAGLLFFEDRGYTTVNEDEAFNGVVLILANLACFIWLGYVAHVARLEAMKEFLALNIKDEKGNPYLKPLPDPVAGKLDAWHLFVSYHWKNAQDQCVRIQGSLQSLRLGCKVFLSEDDRKDGDDDGAMGQYIERSDAVLVFASEDYATSDTCRSEVFHARQHGKSVMIVFETAEKHGRERDPVKGLFDLYATPSLLSEGDYELAEAVEADRISDLELLRCRFWFLKRDYILKTEEKQLGKFQDLLRQHREPVLEELAISQAAIVRGEGNLQRDICIVSHRWLGEEGQPPDPDGQQLQKLKEHLRENVSIQYVWFDYSCLPQGNRSHAERIDFDYQLKEVNWLYLGCSVLILLDMSYQGRFWTMYESWCSMQTITEAGLIPPANVPTGSRPRFTIKAFGTANEASATSLKDVWHNATPADARKKLSNPDISVTNKSDKINHLDKLHSMNEMVKDRWQAWQAEITQPVQKSAAGARASVRTSASRSTSSARSGGPRSFLTGCTLKFPEEEALRMALAPRQGKLLRALQAAAKKERETPGNDNRPRQKSEAAKKKGFGSMRSMKARPSAYQAQQAQPAQDAPEFVTEQQFYGTITTFDKKRHSSVTPREVRKVWQHCAVLLDKPLDVERLECNALVRTLVEEAHKDHAMQDLRTRAREAYRNDMGESVRSPEEPVSELLPHNQSLHFIGLPIEEGENEDEGPDAGADVESPYMGHYPLTKRHPIPKGFGTVLALPWYRQQHLKHAVLERIMQQLYAHHSVMTESHLTDSSYRTELLSATSCDGSAPPTMVPSASAGHVSFVCPERSRPREDTRRDKRRGSLEAMGRSFMQDVLPHKTHEKQPSLRHLYVSQWYGEKLFEELEAAFQHNDILGFAGCKVVKLGHMEVKFPALVLLSPAALQVGPLRSHLELILLTASELRQDNNNAPVVVSGRNSNRAFVGAGPDGPNKGRVMRSLTVVSDRISVPRTGLLGGRALIGSSDGHTLSMGPSRRGAYRKLDGPRQTFKDLRGLVITMQTTEKDLDDYVKEFPQDWITGRLKSNAWDVWAHGPWLQKHAAKHVFEACVAAFEKQLSQRLRERIGQQQKREEQQEQQVEEKQKWRGEEDFETWGKHAPRQMGTYL